MDFCVSRADLSDPAFSALVARHVSFCDATAPAESCHRLPLKHLAATDVTVWTAISDAGVLLGMGALKALSPQMGEIKSMHTTQEARGQGVARALLQVIHAEALARGYASLWLETGTHDDFAPARALYRAHGFVETGAFGTYQADPHSIYMTLPLV